MLKMTILRLLGSSDDKEKIGVARPEGPHLRWFRCELGFGTYDEQIALIGAMNLEAEGAARVLQAPVKPAINAK